MKILLIDTPFYRFIKYYNRFFPLGLAYLAAQLCDQGHDVVIYDADANVGKNEEMDFSILESKYPKYIEHVNDLSHSIWDELRDTLKRVRPNVVGISVYTTKIAAALRTAQICKSIAPHIPVVTGGPHPSVKADEILRISPYIDFAIRGEGEVSFLQLVDALENGKPYNNIKGLSFKHDGRIYHNPDAEFIKELDKIPYPARELLINRDSYSSEDMGLIMTGRGCPFSCTFCSSKGVWKRIVRLRSVENVINEIQQVQAKYNTTQFSLKDDTFPVNRERVLEFCKVIKEKRLKIGWDCNVRANLVDESLLKTMKSAGCNGIKMGIESGSDRILTEIMKKGITVAQVKHAAKLLNKVSIHWTGYFMMGLPTETSEEMRETFRLAKQIKPDFVSLSVYEPFPGTELYNRCLAMGCIADDRTLEDYYTISPKYYYIRNLEQRTDSMPEEDFSQIEDFMKGGFHKYNRNPMRIFKRAKARRSLYLNDPALILSDLKKFLAWLG